MKPSRMLSGPISRISHQVLMNGGNELRKTTGGTDALALAAVADINSRRPASADGERFLSGRAFVFNQLKHPDEAITLRTIYRDAFHLIGVHCAEEVRREYLTVGRSMSQQEADILISRDKGDEEEEHGQKVTETFQYADVFIDFEKFDMRSSRDATEQVCRYFDLLFGRKILTPTPDEYGMFLAQSAALRSADLSRQVGAAILSPTHEVISVGTNEVPSGGGGQYWGTEESHRDLERGADANALEKDRILKEVLAVSVPGWEEMGTESQITTLRDASKKLKTSRIMNLTEFGRAVHAEMDAILAAGRVGVPVRGCTLYCTTFPCHNCAKHIINAGIQRVVYVEPYPKSMARELHSDAIRFGAEAIEGKKVWFEAFPGVAPRMYSSLFSMANAFGSRHRRKKPDGTVQELGQVSLRIKGVPLSYIEREETSADLFRRSLLTLESTKE